MDEASQMDHECYKDKKIQELETTIRSLQMEMAFNKTLVKHLLEKITALRGGSKPSDDVIDIDAILEDEMGPSDDLLVRNCAMQPKKRGRKRKVDVLQSSPDGHRSKVPVLQESSSFDNNMGVSSKSASSTISDGDKLKKCIQQLMSPADLTPLDYQEILTSMQSLMNQSLENGSIDECVLLKALVACIHRKYSTFYTKTALALVYGILTTRDKDGLQLEYFLGDCNSYQSWTSLMSNQPTEIMRRLVKLAASNAACTARVLCLKLLSLGARHSEAYAKLLRRTQIETCLTTILQMWPSSHALHSVSSALKDLLTSSGLECEASSSSLRLSIDDMPMDKDDEDSVEHSETIDAPVADAQAADAQAADAQAADAQAADAQAVVTETVGAKSSGEVAEDAVQADGVPAVAIQTTDLESSVMKPVVADPVDTVLADVEPAVVVEQPVVTSIISAESTVALRTPSNGDSATSASHRREFTHCVTLLRQPSVSIVEIEQALAYIQENAVIAQNHIEDCKLLQTLGLVVNRSFSHSVSKAALTMMNALLTADSSRTDARIQMILETDYLSLTQELVKCTGKTASKDLKMVSLSLLLLFAQRSDEYIALVRPSDLKQNLRALLEESAQGSKLHVIADRLIRTVYPNNDLAATAEKVAPTAQSMQRSNALATVSPLINRQVISNAQMIEIAQESAQRGHDLAQALSRLKSRSVNVDNHVNALLFIGSYLEVWTHTEICTVLRDLITAIYTTLAKTLILEALEIIHQLLCVGNAHQILRINALLLCEQNPRLMLQRLAMLIEVAATSEVQIVLLKILTLIGTASDQYRAMLAMIGDAYLVTVMDKAQSNPSLRMACVALWELLHPSVMLPCSLVPVQGNDNMVSSVSLPANRVVVVPQQPVALDENNSLVSLKLSIETLCSPGLTPIAYSAIYPIIKYHFATDLMSKVTSAKLLQSVVDAFMRPYCKGITELLLAIAVKMLSVPCNDFEVHVNILLGTNKMSSSSSSYGSPSPLLSHLMNLLNVEEDSMKIVVLEAFKLLVKLNRSCEVRRVDLKRILLTQASSNNSMIRHEAQVLLLQLFPTVSNVAVTRTVFDLSLDGNA